MKISLLRSLPCALAIACSAAARIEYDLSSTTLTEKHMMEDAEKKYGDPARWKEIQAQVFATLPFKRSGRPAEVADLVAFLASARASYISATLVTIDAGQSLRQRL